MIHGHYFSQWPHVNGPDGFMCRDGQRKALTVIAVAPAAGQRIPPPFSRHNKNRSTESVKEITGTPKKIVYLLVSLREAIVHECVYFLGGVIGV